jgi:branched-chain amino acid transport system permease protein
VNNTPTHAVLATLGAGALVAFPFVANGYYLALGISILYFTVLATAWGIFSGPTRYISLATVAFFGIGAYTAAVCGEAMPWPLVLIVAALVGAAVAAVVGLSTLRLAGIYFVIFSFGLAELIRQLVIWYEVNVHRSVGRYLFTSVTQETIYLQLLGLTVAVFLAGWLLGRSRLGLALRAIGADETAARHAGIDATAVKLGVFVLSAVFMTLTGAVMAPRWTYIDPAIAFNPMISFQVVIMALLGGAGSLFGPVLGVIPLVLLFEVLTATLPNSFSIVLGAVFIAIVYALPQGVIGLMKANRDWLWPSRLAPPAEGPGELLAVADLTKSFGGLRAVDGVCFTVNPGEIVGLIGPNGSGKTTVLNMLSGELKPDAGRIYLAGEPIVGAAPHRIARLGVARTFQLVRVLPSLTCAENVAAALLFRAKPPPQADVAAAVRSCLDEVGLAPCADKLAGDLTYIDQKRLELARALALEPRLLLLDEWLAGLNPTELQESIGLVAALRKRGLAIVLVEHVMDAIRALCDRCLVMNAGRLIAQGRPADVLADPAVIAAYLGDADA